MRAGEARKSSRYLLRTKPNDGPVSSIRWTQPKKTRKARRAPDQERKTVFVRELNRPELASPLPVEVGCFRLRPWFNCRTRVNPSSVGEVGALPNSGRPEFGCALGE